MGTSIQLARVVSRSADLVLSTTTLASVLSVPVRLNVLYAFEFVAAYTANATTTGSRFVVTGPTLSRLNAVIKQTLTATTETTNFISGYNLPAAANASSLTAGNVCTIFGHILCTADGDLGISAASEVAVANGIVIKSAHLVLQPIG